MIKMLETYNHKLETIRTNHETKIDELIELISGLSYQQTTLLQNLQMPTIEISAARDKQMAHSGTSMARPHLFGEGGQSQLKTHKPRLDFSNFDGVEVHKWLYRCNQYFDIKKTEKSKRLKLASYYLRWYNLILALKLYEKFRWSRSNMRGVCRGIMC